MSVSIRVRYHYGSKTTETHDVAEEEAHRLFNEAITNPAPELTGCSIYKAEKTVLCTWKRGKRRGKNV